MSTANSHEPPEILLTCFVIDDEQAAVNKLESFINKTPNLIFVGSETDPLKAKAKLTSERELPDILFLDIEMKGPVGMKLASLVMNRTCVVFVTGHRGFAADAYRHNAVDYLLKPISYELFLEAVNKCRLQIISTAVKPSPTIGSLFLRDAISGKAFNVVYDDIMYIQSMANYSRVHLYDGTKVMPLILLKRIYAQLKANFFVRIHKSYVINIRYIKIYEGKGTVQLINDITLEVGRTFRKRLKEKIKAHDS